MAGTYYKYAEREADSQVNWAEVGKNLSDTLLEANRLREEKKEALNQATRDYSKTLANAPQGEDGLVNQKTLAFADNATQLMLVQERLFKAGKMKFKDYANVRQNLLDSTDQAFGLAKEYQDEYSKKMERMKNGESMKLEQFEMEQMEGYANMSGMDFYIDPTTGSVSMALREKKDIDGKTVYAMKESPDDFVSVNTARTRLKSYYDKYDAKAATTKIVGMLGENVDAMRAKGGAFSAGTITEITDITKRERFGEDAKKSISLYESAETGFINAELANPYNLMSTLTDYQSVNPSTNQEYTFSFDPEKAKSDPNIVLVKSDNGKTVLDTSAPNYKSQKKVAEQYLREQIRIGLDRREKIDTYSEPNNYQPQYLWEYNKGQGELKKENTELANKLGVLYYGNQQEIDSVLPYFRDKIPNVASISRDNYNVYVRTKVLDKNGKDTGKTQRRVYPLQSNGKEVGQDNFIEDAAMGLVGQSNILDALDQGSYVKGKKLTSHSKMFESQTEDYEGNSGKGVTSTKNGAGDDLFK
jgi:hypothetical protein